MCVGVFSHPRAAWLRSTATSFRSDEAALGARRAAARRAALAQASGAGLAQRAALCCQPG